MLTKALPHLYLKEVPFYIRYAHFIFQFILSTVSVSDLLLLITPSILLMKIQITLQSFKT